MSFEFHGEIRVSDIEEDAIKEAVHSVVTEQEYDEETIALTEKASCSENYMYYYCDGLDEDTADNYEMFFCSVTNRIIKLFPECTMNSHICGTEMMSDTEFVYTVQLHDRHVKVLDLESSVGMVECPECDGGLVTWGELNFDTEYDCEECGRHFSVDKMNEILSEYVCECDVSEFIKNYNC